MKSKAISFVAILLVSLVSAGILSAPLSVDACEPPEEGVYVYNGIDFEQPIPPNGAFAFRASLHSGSIDVLSVEVRDESDTLVEGTVSTVLEQHHGGQSAYSVSQLLVIWTPTESLQAEHDYSVQVQAPSPYDESRLRVDEETTFSTTANAQTDPQLASIAGAPSLRIDEHEGGYECCYDPTYCGACDGTCQHCWATAYVYQPAIDIDVELPITDTDLQTYHRIKTSTDSFKLYWNERNTASSTWLYPEEDPGPHCITLQTFALATQQLLDESEVCFNRDEFPDYTERELEGVTRPETCEEVDAGGHPDVATGDDTASSNDTVSNSDTASSDDTASTGDTNIGNDIAGGGCGCKSTTGAPSPLASVVLFFGALLTLRRRSQRSKH